MNFKGIVHITGEPDTGKTLLALGAYHPKETVYLFDDVKMPPIDQTKFGMFISLVEQYSHLKLLEYREAVLKLLDNIPNGKYKSIVFDTWSRFGLSLRQHAIQNPKEFREPNTFSKLGAAKGGEMWNEAHRYEASVISTLAKKAQFIGLVTHIKDLYIGGAKSGLMRPDCGKSFDKVCNLRLWLRHNEESGVPIALVLKRVSKTTITKDGIEVTNVLPRRLYPNGNDKSVWNVIDRYWNFPVGNHKPTEDEKPTPYEISILDGILTPDQKEVWQAELRAKQQSEKEEKLFSNTQYEEVKAKVKELSGKPPPTILQEIAKDYEGYDLPQIIKMMNGE